MPVDKGGFAEMVLEVDAVTASGLGVDAPHPVGPADVKHRRRFTVDFDRARLGTQNDRRFRGAANT